MNQKAHVHETSWQVQAVQRLPTKQIDLIEIGLPLA